MSDIWKLNDGDVPAGVRALAAAGHPGALVRCQIQPGSPREVRSRLSAEAWTAITGQLPPGTVGARTGWSTFELVLPGERTELLERGHAWFASLSREVNWRVLFIQVDREEPMRTLMCDPEHDLAKHTGDLLAWVEPYAQPDWQEPQRYPTVTLVEARRPE